jgi:tetratricopeptide (TPR) repeat protein
MDTAHLFDTALAYQQANEWAQATEIYRLILSQNEQQATAQQYLGVALSKQGLLREGERHLRLSLQSDTQQLNWHYNLGLNLIQQEKWEDATAVLLATLKRQAIYPEAMNALWRTLSVTQQLHLAEDYLSHALIIQPHHAEWQAQLAYVYITQQKWSEAESAIRIAIAQDANKVEYWDICGHAAMQQGKYAEAVTAYQRLLALNPHDALAQANLAKAYVASDQFTLAEATFKRALHDQPGQVEWQYELGRCLLLAGDYRHAKIYLKQAVAKQPNNHEWLYTYAHCLLSLGDFKQGLSLYEHRFLIPRFNYSAALFHVEYSPRSLASQTVLIRSEVQLGDQIQFLRYLSLLKQHNVRIIYEIHPTLMRLCAQLTEVDEFVPFGSTLPACAVQIPLVSLPRIFNTRPKTIPTSIPYLHSQPDLKAFWHQRLQQYTGYRIGIVWACGSPLDSNGRPRSMRLTQFAPLSTLPNVNLFSLQKGNTAAEVEDIHFPIVHLGGAMHDFADTAAIMDNLDLIITVDTSATHLAGAMGVKTWALLPLAADWRWQSDPEHTAWYPKMRLFRQHTQGDWDAVIQRVKTALEVEFTDLSPAP